MKRAMYFLIGFALAALLAFPANAALSRNIMESWDILRTPRTPQAIYWMQGESIQFDLTVMEGAMPYTGLTNAGVSVVWETTNPNNFTNVIAVATGTVVSAESGEVRFNLSAIEANLTNATYVGYARALVDDGTNTTHMAVLARQNITVVWSPEGLEYSYAEWLTPAFYPRADVDTMTNNLWLTIGTNQTNIALNAGYTNEAHTAYGWGDWSASVTALSTTSTTHTAEITGLTTDLAATSNAFVAADTVVSNALQSQVTSNDTDITGLTSDLGSLTSDVAGLPQLVENTDLLTNHFQTLTHSGGWNGSGWGGSRSVYVHPDRRADLGPSFYNLATSLEEGVRAVAEQWNTGMMTTNGMLVDFSPAQSDVAITNNYCAAFDGTAKLTVPHLTGSETNVTFLGTATPTIAAGEITFAVGLAYELLLSDGTHYLFSGGPGAWPLVRDVSGQGGDATYVSATRDTTIVLAGPISHNAQGGCGKYLAFDGSGYIAENTLEADNLDALSFRVYFSADVTSASPNSIKGTLTDSIIYYLSFGMTSGAATNETFVIGEGGNASYIRDTIPAGWRTITAEYGTDRYEVSIDGIPQITYKHGAPPRLSSHQIHLGRRGATGAFSEFGLQFLEINGTRYDAKNAYDNGTNVILPDLLGTNLVVGYTPADLSNPGYDLTGDLLTNPAGLVHNGHEGTVGGMTYGDFLTTTNPLDHVTVNTNGFVTEYSREAP